MRMYYPADALLPNSCRSRTGRPAPGRCSRCSAASSSSTGSTSRWSAWRCRRSATSSASPPRSSSGSSPATCSATAGCCCSAAAPPTCSAEGACCSSGLSVFVVASADRRAGQRRHAAGHHARAQGHERGLHRARRPLDHHHHVQRGPEPQPGARLLHRHRGERLLARPRVRRAADRARLALDVPAAGAVRARHPAGRAARDPARPADPGRAAALRHRRRGDDHRRDAAARAHGRRGARERLGRPADRGARSPRWSPCWSRS